MQVYLIPCYIQIGDISSRGRKHWGNSLDSLKSQTFDQDIYVCLKDWLVILVMLSTSVQFRSIPYNLYTTYQTFNKSALGGYLQCCISWKYDIRFHGFILFYNVFLSCCSNTVAIACTVGVIRVSKDQSPAILHSKAIVPGKCDLLQYLRPGYWY